MAFESNATGVIIVGLFDNGSDAQQAVSELRASGLSSRQIGAAFRQASGVSQPHESTSGEVKREAESWWDKVKDAFRGDDSEENRRERTAASGDVAADPYGTDRYSLAENDYEYAGDDFERSLTETGIPPERVTYLTRNLRSGGAIVTVRDTDRVAEVEQILSRNRGKIREEGSDVSNLDAPAAAADFTSPAYASTGTYTDAGRISPEEEQIENARRAENTWGIEGRDSGLRAGEDRDPDFDRSTASRPQLDRVQLFGEVLRVHKDRISRGEVRLRKEVVTEEQQIEVPVTREELVLERVDGHGTPAPSATIGQAQEVRVPLSEDRVRVEKQPVLQEEVAVGKREVSDVARLNEQVRREELRVGEDPAGDDIRRPA
jgi:uncharacterized protein (TIGR02271 family)